MVSIRGLQTICIAALALLLCACAAHTPASHAPSNVASPPCLAEAPAPSALPHWRPLHDLPDFWITKRANPRQLLLDVAQIADFNSHVRSMREDGWPSGRWEFTDLPPVGDAPPADDLPPASALPLQRQKESLARFIAALDGGKYVLLNGEKPSRLADSLRVAIEAARPAAEVRLVHTSAPLRCFPTDEGVYERPWQIPFDQLQCSQLRLGEPVFVMAQGRDFYLVSSSYGLGWVRPTALTPPLSAEDQQRFLQAPSFVVVLRDHLAVYRDVAGGPLADARLAARLPLIGEEEGRLQVLLPTARGLEPAWIIDADKVSRGYLPLTWRNLVDVAFGLRHTPYGWGGAGEYRDCSRIIMDIFGVFGLLVPRNSYHQALASRTVVDVTGLDEKDKATAIEEAGARGVLLLYMPGHIMLYLGRDGGEIFAFHQFSGFLTPCAGGGETMKRANRAAISSLRLGEGGSRGSFLQRITKLVIVE